MNIRAITLQLLAGLWIAHAAVAGDLSALARLDPAASRVADESTGIAIDLAISQAVPYRVYLLNDPPRLVADFSEIDFGPSRPEALDRAERVRVLGWGPIREGWSRNSTAPIGSTVRRSGSRKPARRRSGCGFSPMIRRASPN